MPQLVFASKTQDHFDGRPYSGERLINYFLRPGDGLSPGVLWGASGLSSLAALNTTQVRAIMAQNDKLYACAGGELWEVTTAGVATSLGVVADGETVMAGNGTEIAVVAGGNYYLWDGTSMLAPTPGALTSVNGVTFQDGYFILSGANATRSDVITITGLYDGATIDALDIATAESNPDGLVGILSDHGELWLFGKNSVEVWYNSGAADFPFTRNPGALIEHGCASGQTIAKEDNSVFWVGSEGVVYRASSAAPQVISTRQIETRIKDGTVSGAFVYMDRGHKFYAIIMSGEPALCYDMTTGLWCERNSGSAEGAWLATCSARVGKTWYAGGSDGTVYTIDADTYADGAEVLRAYAQAAPVDHSDAYFTISRVGLTMNTGTVDIGRNPVVALQVSRDGRTWGGEKYRSMARLGNYDRDIYWNGLGAFPQFHARFIVTDPVPRDVYGAVYG